jgi:protease I
MNFLPFGDTTMTRTIRRAAATLAGAAALLGTVALTTAARREAADEAAIRRTIQHYFDGGMSVRKAFHPSARMTFVADTGFSLVPIEEYIARAEEGAKKNPGRKNWGSQEIAEIDVTGDAAVAKLSLGNDRWAVTDYMTLLRIGGEWKIVNKSFTRQAKGGKQTAQ